MVIPPPEVAGLAGDLIRNAAGVAYMARHYLGPDQRLRYHHLFESDDARALHDHPWDFLSVILEGAYLEHTPLGVALFTAGDVVTHRAEDLHRLELDSLEVWTLVLTGPVRRAWGFVTPDGVWRYWRRCEWAGSTEPLPGARAVATAGPSREW